jgi:superfamily II DNA/RNA helicase
VKQEKIEVSESEKYSILLRQLEQREGTVIVFVKTKAGADRLSKKLRAQNHSADAIHGDLRQNQRDRAIKAFQNFHTRIMVATDIAARGLDIPHIETVINYDLPQVAEDYIHRIGRTARNGAEGVAISLVTHEDAKKWYAIQRLLNPHEKPERIGGRGGAPKTGARSRDRDYARSSRPRKGNAPFERKEWSPVGETHDHVRESDRAPVRGSERTPSRSSERAPVRGTERDYANDTQAVNYAAPKKKFADKKKFSAGRGFNEAQNQDAPRKHDAQRKHDAPRPARKAFSFDDRIAAPRPARAEGAPQDYSASRPPKNADGKKRFGPKGPKPHKADESSPSAPGKPRGFAKSKPWASKSPGGRGARSFKAAS